MEHSHTSEERLQRMKVLAAGVFSLILSMGVARFSYTPLLPLMQQQAGLGLGEAGWLAAINYMGYLSGALLASRISDMVLKDRLYRIGMLLAVFSTVMMGVSNHFAVWALSRFIAGLSTAAGLMLGSGLILNWLIRHHHRSELGIHFSGVGLGIAVCATAALMMRGHFDWSGQWLMLSLLGCLLLIPALGWLPPPDRSTTTRSGKPMVDAPPGKVFLRIFMAAYFCAGFGYVITATFIVAIVDALPGLAGSGIWVFLAVGLAAGPSCILWDFFARRIGEINALIIAAVLQVVGILLPVLVIGLVPAMVGAVLFGATNMGIVSLVLTMAGRYYPTRPAKMMGSMTSVYGVAQIIGPALTGLIAVRHGGYAAGLYVAAGGMTVGAVLLMLLKRIEAAGATEQISTIGHGG